MNKVKKLESNKAIIAKAAGHYLCEETDDELYNAYFCLKEAQHKGDINASAINYATVWQPLEHMSVNQIVELIENEMENSNPLNLPEHLKNIDWELLKKQKKSLLAVIEYFETNKMPLVEDLEGILNLIDAIQDNAVDVYGVDENLVFDLEKDEEDNHE